MSIETEIEELFAELVAAKPEDRTKLDRYREFREVFLGTDAGKRVLYDIMALARLYVSPQTDDPYKLARITGRKDLALIILLTTHREPKQPPDRAQSKEEDNG